jgi:hypothetical protein
MSCHHDQLVVITSLMIIVGMMGLKERYGQWSADHCFMELNHLRSE